jgi:peptide/nickel transport system permease protein
MKTYIIKRLFQSLIVVWLVSIVIFTTMHLTPGDPITILLGQRDVSEEQMDRIRAKWGLDQPVVKQYLVWAVNAFQGDFGRSIAYNGVPVIKLIRQRVPNTALLNLYAFLLAIVVSIPAGILSAVRQYSVFDYATSALAIFAMSLPNFWLALMLLIVFSVWLGWLPTFGIQNWKSYILPCVSVAAMNAAILTRFTRSKMLEEQKQDYVKTARSKGVQEKNVIRKHVIRNAAIPIVTLIGYRFAYILSGTVVIEMVFAWPGVGRLLVESIFRRDYLVVQAITLFAAIIIVLVNLITDLSYTFIDPRVKYD